MWCTFTLLCILSLLRTGAPQDVTTMDPSTTTNSSEETTTPKADNPMCIAPMEMSPDKAEGIDAGTMLFNFGRMRQKVDQFHPGFAGTCSSSGDIAWNGDLQLETPVLGDKCPMVGEPYVPRFEQGPMVANQTTGMNTVFGIDLNKLVELTSSSWQNNSIMKNLTADRAKALVGNYEQGPWDPFFQILWNPDPSAITRFACRITQYNSSDTEALSKIFNMQINQTTELWNLVCLHQPLGSIPGKTAWQIGNCPITTTTEEESPDDPTIEPFTTLAPETTQPNPNPTPPHPMTEAPHAAGKRTGQGFGFNFESLTILMSTILSGNLAH